ncbi:AarF/ABC1/UbiB kinase family protein [Sansalvadorimonas sp. 2012CJ34-2]|uniref:AarF/ABC1/UbiB kinase family protein n=1 Tax=Parendozoicomonas callyspongiae TaxID=2942213 RepID=A0ABT0PJ40_9GAMM|nr:AarF/ABC1/UbiB kinase family protein [Sansalvadorimonas sp. 2012CJ34-2]MCL6271364.1 AarF/ABC1/UbiB kinase family protein [Sansalvadorimonas sp. 2012CJ34-2]
MKDRHGNHVVSRIKTGSIERRLHLASAGLFAGGRMASHMAANLLTGKEKKQERRKQAMSRQATFLVAEMGKLKGSVVKIGQMMALYGEHFLPDEVTDVLHTFEHQTTALKWPVIRRTLREQLGAERLAELRIDRVPIGTASLGQVHRAVRIRDGKELCLKIQYPGVSEAVDSDLNGVTQLLRLTRLIKVTGAFEDWLKEIRRMLHREIDYILEAETTRRFAERLADDPRFVVPEVFPEYCTKTVLAVGYEPGYGITSNEVQQLSQERRNSISSGLLDLFFKEMFSWHEIQTDPNFGNYRIQLGDDVERDRIVLLDFGAVNSYPPGIMNPINQVIAGSWYGERDAIINGSVELEFLNEQMPESIRDAFVTLCNMMIEPVLGNREGVPEHVLDEHGCYLWKESDLPGRIARKATKSAVSRYFKVPPKEFIFLNRKLMGVYTFMSVLDARLDSSEMIRGYLDQP